MSLGNDPSNTPPPIEWTEAIAAADEARQELLFDGSAPSREGILREMGRRPDGSTSESPRTYQKSRTNSTNNEFRQ